MTTEMNALLLGTAVLFALVAGASIYSVWQSKRDKVKLAQQAVQERFDRDKFVDDIAILIDQYHEVIAGYGGKARTQMKREFMRNMGGYLPKGSIRMILPYLEDGMTGDDFVIDMSERPELLQHIIDGR